MRGYLKTIIVAIFVLTLPTGGLAFFKYPSEPEGFRGVYWGTPFGSVAGLTETRRIENKNIVYYAREGDRMEVGSVPVESIEYGFYGERFFAVTIKTKDYKTFSMLKVSCTNMFGIGTVINPNSDLYVWAGMVAIVRLRYDRDKTGGVLTMTSTEMYRQMQQGEPPMDPMEWKPSKEGF